MSEDITSLKAVGRYLAACAAAVFMLLRLSDASESDQQQVQEGPASFVRPEPDAPIAKADTALPRVRVKGDTTAALNPFDKPQHIIQPGDVEEDDAPAGVKELDRDKNGQIILDASSNMVWEGTKVPPPPAE